MILPQQIVIRGNAAELRRAADTLEGRRLRAGVRGFVIPADGEQYSLAVDHGAIRALHDAGFVICAPGTPDPALVPGKHGSNPIGDEDIRAALLAALRD